MKFTEKYRCWSATNVIINSGVLSLINVITSHLAPPLALNYQTCKSALNTVEVTPMTRSVSVSQAVRQLGSQEAETDKKRRSVLMSFNLFIQVKSRHGNHQDLVSLATW